MEIKITKLQELDKSSQEEILIKTIRTLLCRVVELVESGEKIQNEVRDFYSYFKESKKRYGVSMLEDEFYLDSERKSGAILSFYANFRRSLDENIIYLDNEPRGSLRVYKEKNMYIVSDIMTFRKEPYIRPERSIMKYLNVIVKTLDLKGDVFVITTQDFYKDHLEDQGFVKYSDLEEKFISVKKTF